MPSPSQSPSTAEDVQRAAVDRSGGDHRAVLGRGLLPRGRGSQGEGLDPQGRGNGWGRAFVASERCVYVIEYESEMILWIINGY